MKRAIKIWEGGGGWEILLRDNIIIRREEKMGVDECAGLWGKTLKKEKPKKWKTCYKTTLKKIWRGRGSNN